MEDALELMPEIVGDETVGVKYAINGLIALTPDGMPLLGETPEVKGLWSAAAVWVKEGPAGRQEHRRVDDQRRARDRLQPERHQPPPGPPADAPAHQGPRVRGVPQDLRHRPPGRAVPVRPPAPQDRRCTTGRWRTGPSSSRSPAGSARSGTGPTPACWRSTASGPAPTSGTRAGGARSSTPSTSRCARRPASSTCRRSRSSTSWARGRSPASRGSRCARWTSRWARSSTPRCCPRPAASRATSRSCASSATHFRVVTGGAHGMADLKWFRDRLAPDAALVDLTTAYATIGVWGPRRATSCSRSRART